MLSSLEIAWEVERGGTADTSHGRLCRARESSSKNAHFSQTLCGDPVLQAELIYICPRNENKFPNTYFQRHTLRTLKCLL